jgi:hypothetical protein
LSLVVVLAWAASPASALTTSYNLATNITNTASYLGDQLFVDVVSISGQPNRVDFVFRNEGPRASSIGAVYFDDDSLLTLLPTTVRNDTGVWFSAGANPANLPGSSPWNFQATSNFSADANVSDLVFGVNPGERLTMRFGLQGGRTYADVIHAINLAATDPTRDLPGGLRIGASVLVPSLSILWGDPCYDSYLLSVPAPVPEPSTLAIAGLGALGMIGHGLRRRGRI